MGMQCDVCGKKPAVGNQYTRRGKAKYLGGVGRKADRHQQARLQAEPADASSARSAAPSEAAACACSASAAAGFSAGQEESVLDADQPLSVLTRP